MNLLANNNPKQIWSGLLNPGRSLFILPLCSSTCKIDNSPVFLFRDFLFRPYFAGKKIKVMKKAFGIFILLICLLAAKAVFAQSPTQVIRGTEIDKQSLITLP